MDKIQQIFNNYQKKYPLEQREFIINKMLDDGVITFEDARILQKGKSVFSIKNSYSIDECRYLTPTEIMGGYFSTNTNFNKKIEPTNQSIAQGDCWLLSEINSLNLIDWGRTAIEKAIIPDEDGKGGVTVKFNGSPLEQKCIYITAEEIVKARNSGNYTKEDDDVLALELATEKVFREMVKQGLAERISNDESLELHGVKYRSFISGGVKTNEYEQYPLAKLLGIEIYQVNFLYMNERENAENEKEEIFNYLAKNSDIALTTGFCYLDENGYGDKNSKDYIHGKHAYSIKEININENVTLIDPFYSDYEINMPWNEFLTNISGLNLIFKNNEAKQSLIDKLPENLDDYLYKYKEYIISQEKERKAKYEQAQKGTISWNEYYNYLDELKPFEY